MPNIMQAPKKYAPSGVIHKRILQEVLESDVMIVDLSTKNPNVIYDLGIGQAVQRGRTFIQRVFIGHGRSKLWGATRGGESIVGILEKMMEQATFAVLVMT
jgi:hypothetical protein